MSENTIRIGQCHVRADDVAQVLGKTGTLLGRVVARVRLSYAMGRLVDRESLGKEISGITHKDLSKVLEVFDKTVKSPDKKTSETLEISSARLKVGLLDLGVLDEFRTCLEKKCFMQGEMPVYNLNFSYGEELLHAELFRPTPNVMPNTITITLTNLTSSEKICSLKITTGQEGQKKYELNGASIEGLDVLGKLKEYLPLFAAASDAARERALEAAGSPLRASKGV